MCWALGLVPNVFDVVYVVYVSVSSVWVIMFLALSMAFGIGL